MAGRATLYVVSTPIGNLEDVSRRMARILGEVTHVAAEDTRRTGLLLQHLEIRTDLLSLHAHNEAARIETVLGWLGAGEDVALVTDAGTPLVSDPGGRLVAAVVEAGHPVVPVPGPSAVLAALVGSGLPAERFAMLGFVPRKGGDRRSTLERIAGSEETTIFFESPERVARTLDELAHLCEPERHAAVARELTKLHEEFRRGTVAELAAYYSREGARGEITVVVAPAPPVEASADEDAVRDRARALLADGLRPSRAARVLADETGVARNDAYALIQDLKTEDGGEDG